MNYQGFLDELQDWEHSLHDKDKKVKRHASGIGKSFGERCKCCSMILPTAYRLFLECSSALDFQPPNLPAPFSVPPPEGSRHKKQSVSRSKSDHSSFKAPNYGSLSPLSSDYVMEETFVDASSEKELGNEFFKQKKFNEAIDCYSRSIALSPTSVAYANRAMAYLKVKRFQEAEADCTEALNLDDRYIKAYSRRATARKELGNLKEALDDAQFALRLEPDNQEVKKQSAELRSLLEKAIFQKASGDGRSSAQTVKIEETMSNSNVYAKDIRPSPGSNKRGSTAKIADSKMIVDQVIPKITVAKAATNDKNEVAKRTVNAGSQLSKAKPKRQELAASVHELASRAASRAMTEAAKNISPPNSAYQFEALWKGFRGDRSLQTQLLKVTRPETLPQIFKNALSASILMDIVNCLASSFTDDPELAVDYLKNLTEVSRFGIIIMCLPAATKAELHRIWDEVFLSKVTPIEYAEALAELRPKYYSGLQF